ncbi:hypothetical protein MMC07_002447 [Pseudocyphellaria aurata]|nr:hypothetical protein [Pseudocyphellaria aurata]
MTSAAVPRTANWPEDEVSDSFSLSSLPGPSGDDMNVRRQPGLLSPLDHESDNDMSRGRKPDPSNRSSGKCNDSDSGMDMEKQLQQALGAAGERPTGGKLCMIDVLVNTLLTKQLDRPMRRAGGEKSDNTKLQVIFALLGANPAKSLELLCYHHARMLASC